MHVAPGVFAAILALSALLACGGRGDIDLKKATPLGVEPTTDTGSQGQVTPARLFTFQPGEQVSFKVLADGTEVGGSPIINDFDGDGMDNTNEVTTNVWTAEYPQISTRVVTPVTMQVEAMSYQTGLTDLGNYAVSGGDLSGEASTSSERFYKQTLSAQAAQYEKSFYPSGVPSGQVADFITPGLGFLSLAGQSSGYNNGSGWSAYSQPAPVAPVNIDGAFAADVNVFNWVFKPDFSANAGAQYRIWKREKEANSYQISSNAGKVRIAMYIKNSGSNVPVKLSNILAALVFETQQGNIITAANFRLRDVSSANLYSLEMNANTEFGPYLIEVPGISTDLIEKAIRFGYTPQIRLLDYDMTHASNSPYRLSLNFTGENLKVMANNAMSRSAKINIIGPTARQTFAVAAFATSTETATDACAPLTTPDASSTASPGVPLTRALDRIACSLAVGGKVGGVPVVEYQNYVLDFTGVPLYDAMNPKIVYVTGIKRIADVANNVACDPAYTNVCYIRFANYLTNPNNDFAIWTVFAKGQYFNYSQFDYVSTSGSGNVKGYPSGTFNSNTRVGAIPKLKGVSSTIWAGDAYDVVYMKVSDIIALRGQPGGTPMESGAAVTYNTKWDLSTVGNDPYAPDAKSRFIGKATLGDTIELTFNLKNTTFLNPDFGPDVDPTSNLAFNQFTYNRQVTAKKFTADQAIDFELNLGLSNQASDWQNILQGNTCLVRPKAVGSEEIKCVKTTTDFVNQKFTVQVQLPASHNLASSGSLLNLYLRPTLSNAYRNSIWPQDYRLIKKFDSTVYEAAAAGTLVKLNPGAGSILDIIPGVDKISITSGAVTNQYGVASVSVASSYGYDVILSTNLLAPISPGDRAAVDAGLSQAPVIMKVGFASALDNIFALFNSQNPQQSLFVSNNDAVNCTASVLVPTRCYGYVSTSVVDYIVNNWIGNLAYANSWVDGRAWLTFANNYVFPYSLFAVNNRQFELRGTATVPSVFSTGNDFLASATTGHDQQLSDVSVAADKALIVWQSDVSGNGTYSEIRGRVVDVSTGQVQGTGDFVISTTAAYSTALPRLVTAGDKALVVWVALDSSNAGDIKGRMVDLTSGQPLGTGDMLLSTTSMAMQFVPQISIADTKAIIVWQSSDNGVDYDVRGRFFDMSGGFPMGTGDMLISSNNVGSQASPQVSVSGDKAIVVWQSTMNGSQYVIRTRLLDIINGTVLGTGDFAASQTASAFRQSPQVAASGNRSLIVWYGDGAGDWDVRGSVVDMTGNGSLINSDFLLSSASGGYQYVPQVAAAGSKAVVAWLSDADIRGTIVDLSSGLPAAGGDVLLSSTTVPNFNRPQVKASGNSAIISWHASNGVDLDIRGRILNLQTGVAAAGSDFLISSTTAFDQATPLIGVYGSQALVAWPSRNASNELSVRAAFVTLPDVPVPFVGPLPYGANNFFTAPLIERNYEATAQIVK